MRRFGLLLGLFLMSACQPESSKTPLDNTDMIKAHKGEVSKTLQRDSTEMPKIQTEQIVNHQIIQTIDAKNLPMTLKENFTKDNQTLTIKIEGYKRNKLNAEIVTDLKNFNIRFNQIRTADGKYDGPFGRTIKYDTPVHGEVWLIIGSDLMASGAVTGTFWVKIQ